MIEAKCEHGNCSFTTNGTVLDIVVEAAVLLKGILRNASDGDDGKRAFLEVLVADFYKKLEEEECVYVDVALPKKGGEQDEP